MRVSELLGLQQPDIDRQRRLIHVPRTFYRRKLCATEDSY
jgi:integrase